MNDPRKFIERRMHRLVGMSPEKLEAMHKASGSQEWWCRCWNCRRENRAIRDELKTCSHCGCNLWSRT